MSAVTANGNLAMGINAPMSGRQRFMHNFLQNRVAVISAVYLVILLAVAVFGEALLIHDPYEADLEHVLEGPTAEHWLGTDHLGRSTLSRVVAATATALKAAALGVGIALLLGAPTGLLSGYFGGWWDRIAMRIADPKSDHPLSFEQFDG